MFERLADLVNGDEALVRRGRFLTTTFLLQADEATWLVRVVEGRVERVERGPFLMYLLTGEYDFSCQPDDTLRTAAKIPGARVTVMTAIGHFPMSEHPAQFRRYLLPVLDDIRAHP